MKYSRCTVKDTRADQIFNIIDDNTCVTYVSTLSFLHWLLANGVVIVGLIHEAT